MATVLVCDDAMFMRGALKKIIEPKGHKVVAEAGDGAEALKMYQLFRPEIVLMDITMEGMDGITAVKELIKIDPAAKIIMVSAMGQQERVFEAIKSGAKDFVVKPFKEETVIECIARYV